MESANLSSVMALERRVGGPAQCSGFRCIRTKGTPQCFQVVAVPAAISFNLLPCNQQVRELEGAVAAAGTDAAAGRAEAKQARAALAALEWRVDKVRGGVLGGSGKALRLLPTILKAHVSSAVIRASALEAAARSSRQSKSLPACSDCCLPSPALPSHSPPMPPSARSRPWRPGRTRCAANCTL